MLFIFCLFMLFKNIDIKKDNVSFVPFSVFLLKKYNFKPPEPFPLSTDFYEFWHDCRSCPNLVFCFLLLFKKIIGFAVILDKPIFRPPYWPPFWK